MDAVCWPHIITSSRQTETISSKAQTQMFTHPVALNTSEISRCSDIKAFLLCKPHKLYPTHATHREDKPWGQESPHATD